MSTFPASIKNFLVLQDGVDRVIAQHPNERGDEITAIETLLGALGSSQAYSDSFKNLLLAYRRGCSVEYKGAADLYVRTGEIAIPDVSGNVRLRRNTSDVTVTWANLDTGAEASSTVYYVYAVADASGTTFTVKISTSATTPSGCTYYKLIGTFYNDGSSNVQEVSNLGAFNGFGNWVSKSTGTVYQATTDGIVVAIVNTASSGAAIGSLFGYTDGSNPPTTLRSTDSAQYNNTNNYGSVTFPVKKGNYYQVTVSTQAGSPTYAMYFIPTGS